MLGSTIDPNRGGGARIIAPIFIITFVTIVVLYIVTLIKLNHFEHGRMADHDISMTKMAALYIIILFVTFCPTGVLPILASIASEGYHETWLKSMAVVFGGGSSTITEWHI